MITWEHYYCYILEVPLKLVDVHNYKKSLTEQEYKTIATSYNSRLREVHKILDFIEIDEGNKGCSKYYIKILIRNGKTNMKRWTIRRLFNYIDRIELISKEYVKYHKKSRHINIKKLNIPEKEAALMISRRILEDIENSILKDDKNFIDLDYIISARDYSILRLSRLRKLI